MFIRLILLSWLSISFAQSNEKGIFDAWKGFSDPEIMASGFKHKMSELPLQGSIPDGTKGWSGGYWASQKGGINIRWNSPTQEGFKYTSPSKAQVFRMSINELASLAPTEKYDLFTGSYDYPMKKLAATAADKNAPDWAGICHGWSAASLNHNEPTPKILTNLDGIRIPFGSSDIKALLSYYYAYHHETDTTHQVGLRCFFGSWMGGSKACDEDLNAGAFHIVLTNMLGIRKEGLVADVDRFKQVWNQPVVGFKTKILADNLKPAKGAAENSVKGIKVQTEFFYADESENSTWEVAYGTPEQQISKKDYIYTLEIDARGQIVGGSWESEVRPDFLWNKEKASTFEGILYRLPELLNDL